MIIVFYCEIDFIYIVGISLCDTKGMQRTSSRIEKLKHQSFEQNETSQTKPSLAMTDSVLHASFLTNIDQNWKNIKRKKDGNIRGEIRREAKRIEKTFLI